MSDTAKVTEAIEAALDGMGKATAMAELAVPGVTAVARDMGQAFAKSGKERVEDFLTDDDETNRLRMNGIALANEINSTIDWLSVPLDVMKAGLQVLKLAAGIAAIV